MKIATTGERNAGLAKVQLHPSQPKVKVTVEQKEGEAKVYILNKEDCPDCVQNGTFLVDLSSDGKKMYNIRPVKGVFDLKVKEFVHAKDKEPMPKVKEGGGDKGKYSYMKFTVTMEIVAGKFKGMLVPCSLPYNFQEAKEEVPGKGLQSVVEISHPGSKYTKLLIDFLTVTGTIDQVMPYRENILPMLQKHVLKNDRKFSGGLENGWVSGLYESEE